MDWVKLGSFVPGSFPKLTSPVALKGRHHCRKLQWNCWIGLEFYNLTVPEAGFYTQQMLYLQLSYFQLY
jgi:hypothetical protein